MAKIIVIFIFSLLVACSQMQSRDDVDDGAGIDVSDTSGERSEKRSSSARRRTGQRLEAKYQPLAQALKSGKAQAIIDEAGKVLAQDAHDVVALNVLAMHHYRSGRVGAAKILLNKAFEKHPNDSALHNNLALIFLAEGDQVAAMASLRRALKADDGNANALGNLGSLYGQIGDNTKALLFLEQSYKKNRSNPEIANNYAVALRAHKKFRKAEDIYDDLMKEHPRDVTILLNYATLMIDYMNKPKDGLAAVYKVKFLEADRKDVIQRANELEKKAKSEVK